MAKQKNYYQAGFVSEINLRRFKNQLGVSFDETHGADDVERLWKLFGLQLQFSDVAPALEEEFAAIPENCRRSSEFLTHPVFNSHHSENANASLSEIT